MSASAVADAPATKKERVPLNGINTPALFATIDVVRNQPQLGQFQFRAKGKWMGGTHMRTTMADFSGAGGEHSHRQPSRPMPTIRLCSAARTRAQPGGVRAARAGCLPHRGHRQHRRGARRHAAFGESSLAGDIDLRGILGLSNEVRNGFSDLRVRFAVKGDAPAEKLEEIVQQACARSAVLDILRNGIPVSVETET